MCCYSFYIAKDLILFHLINFGIGTDDTDTDLAKILQQGCR